MPIDYSISKPTAGTSRSTSPTEVEILTDVSDTIADVGSRLDTLESGTSQMAAGVSSEFSQLMAMFDSGRSTALGIIGDSTGNGETEWAYVVAEWLAARNPTYTVKHMLWDGVDSFDAATVIQAGGSGERYFYSQDASTGAGVGVGEADAATNRITGDLDVAVDLAADDWANGVEQTIASKFDAGGERSWRFMLSAGGAPQFQWSTDGTALSSLISASGFTVPADGARKWLRVTFQPDNGAGGHSVAFYESTDGDAWTQIGTTTTTAGTTILFGGTGSPLRVGARGELVTGGAHLAGRIYEARIRDGIDGPLVAPALPEHWGQQGAGNSFGGSPVLTVVNASQAGAGMDEFIVPDTLDRMTPNYGQALTLVSSSHGDANRMGVEYLADWDTLLGLIQARLPLSGVALTTQNPRTSPADYIDQHAVRRAQLLRWAAANGVGAVDGYGAIVEDGRALSVLVDTDGVHPTVAGSQVWADAVTATLAAS